MALKEYDALVISAKRLRNAAPAEYDDVVRELLKLGTSLRAALVQVAPDQVFNFQGRCQQFDLLLVSLHPPEKPAAQ